MDHDLQKHSAEFGSALRQHKYEKTADGLYFPEQKAVIRGVYTHSVNGQDERTDENIIVTEGLNHLLSVTLNAGSQNAAWYVSLFGANVTPSAGWTAASYPATATEITSGVEGYTEGTRPAFSPAAPASGVITNTASKASFTIATASSLNVYGAGLHSVSTKGGTTGVLLSSAAFASVRVLQNADLFSIGYTLTLTSS